MTRFSRVASWRLDRIAGSFGVFALVSLAAAAAPAEAHIELKPKRAPAESRVVLTFQVENERADAGTRKLEVKLPGGIASVSPRALRGWTLKLRKADQQVTRMTLTAPHGKEIPPGESSRSFKLVVSAPARAGRKLAFKTLQTYTNGEIVRWIGPPESDEPAPRLTLTTAKRQDQAARRPTPAPEGSREAVDRGGDDNGGDTLVIVLVVGTVLAAIAVALFGLFRRRRS